MKASGHLATVALTLGLGTAACSPRAASVAFATTAVAAGVLAAKAQGCDSADWCFLDPRPTLWFVAGTSAITAVVLWFKDDDGEAGGPSAEPTRIELARQHQARLNEDARAVQALAARIDTDAGAGQCANVRTMHARLRELDAILATRVGAHPAVSACLVATPAGR